MIMATNLKINQYNDINITTYSQSFYGPNCKQKMLELPFVMGALIKPLAEKLNEDSSCADFLGKSMLIWLYAAISCLSSSLQPEESTSAR
jgi:hypothetical protein